MALEDTEVLVHNGGHAERVLKELCYRMAEMLMDAEEVLRWWWYNLLQ
jgi:hypothetical protein